MMPWTLVLNPVAGRGRHRDRAPELRALAQRWSLDVEVVTSESATDAETLARKAGEAGRDLIAAGGDGTVGLVAGVAAETGRLLGIVPTGAGNDFAATLGYDRKRLYRKLVKLGLESG